MLDLLRVLEMVMTSELLKALPAFHGIIIGVSAAFFSAYLIPANQKILEAEDDIINYLKEISNLLAPSIVNNYDAYKLLNDDGSLDWDRKIRKRFIEIISKCEKNRGVYCFLDLSDSEIEKLRAELQSIIDYVCINFAFGSYQPALQNASVRQLRIYQDYFEVLSKKINLITAMWSSRRDGIIALGEKSDDMFSASRKAHYDESEKKSLARARAAGVSEEVENATKKHFQDMSAGESSFGSRLISSFEKIQVVNNLHLDALKKKVEEYARVVSRYKIKAQLLHSMWVFLWVFVTGILIPLILVSVEDEFSICLPRWLPLMFLMLSVLPYAFYWFLALKIILRLKSD
jgi:hypothetical protein